MFLTSLSFPFTPPPPSILSFPLRIYVSLLSFPICIHPHLCGLWPPKPTIICEQVAIFTYSLLPHTHPPDQENWFLTSLWIERIMIVSLSGMRCEWPELWTSSSSPQLQHLEIAFQWLASLEKHHVEEISTSSLTQWKVLYLRICSAIAVVIFS